MSYKVAIPYADPHMQKIAQWTCEMLDASKETAGLLGRTPAAIVAQAVGEAGWLAEAAIGNNVFGIKAQPGDGWTGTKRLVTTQEWSQENGWYTIQDWFRTYATLADGIYDHFMFFKENSRYANLFTAKSDQEYFNMLQADRYATAPDYAMRLGTYLDSVHMVMAHLSDDGAPPVLPPPRPLFAGMVGDDVKLAQSALKTQGYYDADLDGDFGPKTKTAVMKFQVYKNLDPVDGVVGKDTRAALGI